MHVRSQRLSDVACDIQEALTRTKNGSADPIAETDARRSTVFVSMRDGIRLATDVYLPDRLPAPTVAMRTPYGRANPKMLNVLSTLARSGYVVIAQDCRGTGDSEPDSWDYYIFEPEDSVDLVEWVTRQHWFDGFLGGLGSSYVAQTQWCMAMHAGMSAIVPEVSGIGVAPRTARKYMFYNAYARSVGKGENKTSMGFDEFERHILSETLAGGLFNDPMQPKPLPEQILERYPDLRSLSAAQSRRRLWERYCAMTCAQRADFAKRSLGVSEISILELEALTSIFGPIPHDAFTVPHAERADMCRALRAPALMITGWYDWSMNDALASWALLMREAPDPIRAASRLIITPSAHNTPGYHEGRQNHPELQHSHRVPDHPELLLQWYAAVRDNALDRWPTVIYYLMAANEWRVASAWPPPESEPVKLYLNAHGGLSSQTPRQRFTPSTYVYDPLNATPTAGGSIVSYVVRPGSVDVSEVQQRPDVLTFTSARLERDLDVVGPLRLVLYASSSAADTDFCARLCDVFPDGRAIQLQNGILRARFRVSNDEPEPLEPGRIYRFEIDMWATANRFFAGHQLRLDISSADFPRFDRNTNCGGEPTAPMSAQQTVYHDAGHASYLELHVIHTDSSAAGARCVTTGESNS